MTVIEEREQTRDLESPDVQRALCMTPEDEERAIVEQMEDEQWQAGYLAFLEDQDAGDRDLWEADIAAAEVGIWPADPGRFEALLFALAAQSLIEAGEIQAD